MSLKKTSITLIGINKNAPAISMWPSDSGLRGCQQHKKQVFSFMFAVSRILGENSNCFLWFSISYKLWMYPLTSIPEGLESLQMAIFLNNKLFSSQKILPLEDPIQTEDDKGNWGAPGTPAELWFCFPCSTIWFQLWTHNTVKRRLLMQ